MNYDHFEREIRGYQDEMRRHAERSRILSTGSTRERGTRRPTWSRISESLRELANNLANRLYAPPAHLI